MVLRCKRISDKQDSASSINRVKNKNPAKKDARKSERQKGTGNERANQMVKFILIIHSYSYADGLEQFVKQIDGVENIKVDGNFIELEVTGKVDPSAEMEGDRDKKKRTEGKLKKLIMPINENDKTNEKIEEKLITLKINLCCECCNKRLQDVLKMRGLKMIRMDIEKDLVEVRGAVDMTDLSSYIKDKLRKDMEVVNSTAVMSCTKADDSTTIQECEGKGGSGKKEKDGGAMIKSLQVLKIRLCCNYCNQKFQKILKIQGLEMVTMDVAKYLVTVKGPVDITELRSHIKNELKKDIEVVNSTAVMSSTEADGRTTIQEHKGNSDGSGKKEKDGGATMKSSVALKMRLHCEDCGLKIRKIIWEFKGVEKILTNVNENLIQVNGTINVQKLTSYLKEKVKENVEVISIKKL